jgi:hypothetical protein
MLLKDRLGTLWQRHALAACLSGPGLQLEWVLLVVRAPALPALPFRMGGYQPG